MRLLLSALIAALCVVAGVAIAIVVSGDLDGTAGKVLYTALLVPVYFSTGVVQASLLRRGGALATLGSLGVGIAVAGFAAALYLIWFKSFEDETAARVWGSLLVASIAAAALALLIRRREGGESRLVAATFFATIAATVALAALGIYAIATVEGNAETLGRMIGVLATLWALGIVALPITRARAEAD